MIEQALAECTAALNRVAELLEQSNAGREAALTAAEKLAAGAGEAKTTRKKKEEPAAPAVVDYTGDAGFAKLREVAAGYPTVDDETESAARKAVFKSALEKVGAAKLPEVAEGQRATLAGWLQTLAKGENVPELETAEEPEGDDLLG